MNAVRRLLSVSTRFLTSGALRSTILWPGPRPYSLSIRLPRPGFRLLCVLGFLSGSFLLCLAIFTSRSSQFPLSCYSVFRCCHSISRLPLFLTSSALSYVSAAAKLLLCIGLYLTTQNVECKTKSFLIQRTAPAGWARAVRNRDETYVLCLVNHKLLHIFF